MYLKQIAGDDACGKQANAYVVERQILFQVKLCRTIMLMNFIYIVALSQQICHPLRVLHKHANYGSLQFVMAITGDEACSTAFSKAVRFPFAN